MTTPTQIQNQPLVSCSFFTLHGNLLLPLQPREPSSPKECSFQERGHSHQVENLCSQVCFVAFSWLGSHFHHAFCAQLLQPQQTRIQVTHAADATSCGHCPSSRRVRFTHHLERQPMLHDDTANLQAMGCALRDRDVLTLSR